MGVSLRGHRRSVVLVMLHQSLDLFGLLAFSYTLYTDTKIYNTYEYLIEYQKETPRTLFLTGWQIRTSIVFYIISLFSHVLRNKQLNKLRDTLWLSILFPLG